MLVTLLDWQLKTTALRPLVLVSFGLCVVQALVLCVTGVPGDICDYCVDCWSLLSCVLDCLLAWPWVFPGTL